MSNHYTILYNGFQIQCDTPDAVLALLKVGKGKATAAASKPAGTAASKAAPVARSAASAPAVKTAPVKKVKKTRGKRAGRKMSKAAGLSKRSISILSEIAKSGGASITADKLAKASGAKGSKGLGGSLTSLRRELSSFGYNIDALIARIKGADGTTFSGMSGSDRAIADIIAKVPQVG